MEGNIEEEVYYGMAKKKKKIEQRTSAVMVEIH